MDYLEAVKKVQSRKPKENYMVIKLDYNTHIVLPHSDGIAFLNSLSSAEILKEPYNEPHRIVEFDRSAITSHLMSAEEYERFKIAALLNVTPDEVKQYALQT